MSNTVNESVFADVSQYLSGTADSETQRRIAEQLKDERSQASKALQLIKERSAGLLLPEREAKTNVLPWEENLVKQETDSATATPLEESGTSLEDETGVELSDRHKDRLSTGKNSVRAAERPAKRRFFVTVTVALVLILVVAYVVLEILQRPGSLVNAQEQIGRTLSAIFGPSNHWTVEPRRPDTVSVVAWNTKGELAYGTYSGQVRIVASSDLARPQLYLVGHDTELRTIAWHPANDRLVTASTDTLIRFWRLPIADESTPQPKILSEHDRNVTCLQFSPDGSRFASIDRGGTLCIWDAEANLLHKISAYEAHGSKLSWSPDSQSLVTVGGATTGTVKLWSADGHELALLPWPAEKDKGFNSIEWSPDGKFIAAGGGLKLTSVVVWSVESPPVRSEVISVGEPTLLLHWQSSDQLAVGVKDAVILFKMTGEEIGRTPIRDARVMAVSPDGKELAAIAGQALKVITVNGEQLDELPFHTHVGVQAVVFHPSGSFFVTGETDGAVRFWDNRGNLIRSSHVHQASVGTIAVHPAGTWVATGDDFGNVVVWDADGNVVAKFHEHSDRITGLAWNPSGELLASSSVDRSIRLWNTENLNNASAVESIVLFDEKQSGWVESIKWISDSEIVAGLGKLNGMKLWSIDGTFRQFAARDQQTGNSIFRDVVHDIAVNPAHTLIVAGGSYGNVTMWQPDQIEKPLMQNDHQHSETVRSVDWAPDGSTFVTAGNDGRAWIWTKVGQPIRELEKNDRVGIRKIAFSPNGEFIAAGDQAGKLWLWTKSGENVALLKGHIGGIESLAWSPDSSQIVTIGSHGIIRLWDAKSKVLISASLIQADAVFHFDRDGRLQSGDADALNSSYLYYFEDDGQAKIFTTRQFLNRLERK